MLVQYKWIPKPGKSGAKPEYLLILKLFSFSCLQKEDGVGLSANVWLLITGVHHSWVLQDTRVVLGLLIWAAAERSLLPLTSARFPQ